MKQRFRGLINFHVQGASEKNRASEKKDTEFKGKVASVVDRALKHRLGRQYLQGKFMNEQRFYYDNVHYEVEGHQHAAEKLSEFMMKTLSD